MDTDIDDLLKDFDGEWIGREIDRRYRIIKELAEGGMGTVYIAEHLTLGKEVALKIIHPELAGDDELAERFAREAMATAKLDHPHVASAMDYGKLPEGGAYLVMQLVRGPSLQDVLETQGRVPWARVCAIGAQVADALSAAHARGIIHRDLKPENVMLVPRDDGSELVKVLDFGIARLSDDKTAEPVPRRSRLTRRGTVMGTPGYMSPEQALGENIDERADIYALGTLMWESMVGRTLWEGDTLTDIVQAQLSEDLTPRLAEEANDPTVPPELQALVDAMLAHHADDRPTTASEVRDALRQLTLKATVEGNPNLTPPFGLTRQDPKTAPTMTGHFGPPAKPPWRLIVIGLVSALALIALIVVVSTLSDGPTEEEEAALIERIREEAEAATRMEELERQTGLLLNEESQGIRRAAATYVLDFEPADQVMPWLRALAHLELAGDCREWGRALDEATEIGDSRVLERVDRRFPTGWRRGMRRDPYRCVRTQIDAIVQTLNPEDE